MTYIYKNIEGKYILHDEGKETECRIDKYRDELIIPENTTGRTRTKIKLVGDRMELKPANKTWLDYLTDAERKTYDKLRKDAEARMPKPKNLTPLEKAQRAKERAEAKIAELMAALKS